MEGLELTYTLFIAGAAIPLVEEIDVGTDGPFFSYIKDPTGRYIAVSIMHSSGKNYLAFVDKPTDVDEVNSKLMELLNTSIVKNSKSQRSHIGSVIEGNNTREVVASLSKVFKKDLSEVLDYELMEIKQALAALKEKYGNDALLRDPAMATEFCATPLQRCEHCNKFVEYGTRKLARLPAVDPTTNKLIETLDGDISYKDVQACDTCYASLNYEDIPLSPMHTFKVPITKSETTFDKWPFQRTMGIELESLMVAPINFDKLTKELSWAVVTDSSIRIPNGKKWKPLEFNSRPACGDAFFDNITKGLGLLADRVRVNASCGFHVHIGWEDLDRGQKANVQNLLFGFEKLLFAMQPGSRRNNQYCRLWSEEGSFEASPDKLIESGEKYMGINYSHAAGANLNGRNGGAYGTIEFRMGAGTRNPIKVLMWCEFIHRLVDIGSQLYAKDNYKSLRSMSPERQFNVFKELAAKYDATCERPEEYLKELCVWMAERLTKFGTTIDHVTVPKLDTDSKVVKFNNAKKPSIENVEERYEDTYKTVDTLRGEYDR